MITTLLKLYEYSELSTEAKEKALRAWNETNYDPMMQSHMINLLKEELDERKIKYDVDSIDVRYSLAYCQGDGFMFEGKLTYKGKEVSIKHGSNHYYHSHTADFTYEDEEGNESMTEKQQAAFEVVYHAICKTMERTGYDEIEYQQSEEVFEQACEANEYTFEADGTMRNV